MTGVRILDKAKYRNEFSQTILDENRKRLDLLSWIVSVAMLVMLGCSFFVESLEKNRLIYIVMSLVCASIWVVSRIAGNRKLIVFAMYLFVFAMFIFGILLGTVIEPNETSVSFPILLFVMPLCFSDKAWRMNLAVALGIVLYCVGAFLTQDSLMIQYNLTNVIPYGIFSMLISTIMMNYKFRRYELQYQYEKSLEEQKEQIRRITELNQQLEEAKAIAEQSSMAKTSFLFNMSHDIRTPMNAIIGFRELLEKHQDDPGKRMDYLKKIEDSSNVLLSIINNVLEMSRIEKGTLEIEESAWSAEQFNSTVSSIFEEMMRQKGIQFTTHVEVTHPYVYCDPTKLRDVFYNILSNAYKYTKTGGSVDMVLKEIPSGREGYAVYQTTVTDTGIGMSRAFLPHVFEEFSRENNTTDNKIEGTGLGLPIVKRLVDLMGGTIEVSSAKGIGSTFVVTLSHRIAQRSDLVDFACAEINPKKFEGKRILLAEDNDFNAEIAVEILEDAGFVVERAEDGDICFEKLKSSKDGYYDLILMDIQMPNLNGYEATRAIRNMKSPAKANIPIIAMTANAFEEDKREALRSGMNGHLAKPVNTDELVRTLAGILG